MPQKPEAPVVRLWLDRTGAPHQHIAPIGHAVTVEGAVETSVNITFTLILVSDVSWSSIQDMVFSAIENYIISLAAVWADNDTLIIRISQVEASVLSVSGVEDITATSINGSANNLELASNAIPVLRSVANG